MNYLRSAVVAAAITSIAFTSCKKKHTTSPQSNLIGTWKPYINVADANGNGKWDANDAVDSLKSPYNLQFVSGGAGFLMLPGTSTSIGNFSWEFLSSNTYLKVTYPSSGSTTQHIDSLSTSLLVLRDTTGISTVWQVFTKQ